jgi:ankyrin repeat protein
MGKSQRENDSKKRSNCRLKFIFFCSLFILKGTPLHFACHNGNIAIVRSLIKHGALVNASRKHGGRFQTSENTKTIDTFLLDILTFLIWMSKGTPLHVACHKGHLKVVKYLVKMGADVNVSTLNGTTPLYRACQYGHESIVEFLLDHGADINMSRRNGYSPLYIACLKGHLGVVKQLLSRGANVNSKCADGTTPFFVAVQFGHVNVVKYILENSTPDVEVRSKDGYTPLLQVSSFWSCPFKIHNTQNFAHLCPRF